MTEIPASAPTSAASWKSLMVETNARVAANAAPGSNAYSGWLAAIRTGITASGERTSITQSGRFVADLGPTQRSGIIRAAAIRAINKDVKHTSAMRLGRSLALLAAKEGGSTSVESQIAALPLMNRDAAALILDGLIGRCSRHGIAVNFIDLARTLTFWGTGVGSRSTDLRNRIVLDFYTGPSGS